MMNKANVCQRHYADTLTVITKYVRQLVANKVKKDHRENYSMQEKKIEGV
jgi:hypothetical protein